VGVRHFFLVDRKRSTPVTYENGACYVNNLQRVADLLKAAPGGERVERADT